MSRLFNNRSLKALRKKLRNNSTSAEASLWNILKSSQIMGMKFRRQHSIGPYVLDFYCPEIKLAIELDGQSHMNHLAEEHDEKRSSFLSNAGIDIIRFENKRVFEAPGDIVSEIKEFVRVKKEQF